MGICLTLPCTICTALVELCQCTGEACEFLWDLIGGVAKCCKCSFKLVEKFCKFITSCCGSKSDNKTATYLDSYDIDWEASPLKDPGQHVVINVEEYDM
jgi:hypothetical protein